MGNPNSLARENRNVLPMHGLEDSFPYEVDPPTLDADQLMAKPIVRPDSANSLVLRRFSQTPLAPELLLDMSIPYPGNAERALMVRIDEAAVRTGIADYYSDAMKQEVGLEHDKRIKANGEAGLRLRREIAGRILGEDDASLIWKARTGDADLSEAAELLLRYPIMGSIEAAKHTEPLSPDASKKMKKHIEQGLFGIARQVSSPSRVGLKIFNAHDAEFGLRPIDMSIDTDDEYAKTIQTFMRGSKENLAVAERDGVKIQLVYKQTKMVIDPNIELIDTVPRIIIERGQRKNLQDISFSCYWRVV